jgi:hypothetical protein
MGKVKIDALEVATERGPVVVMADFIGPFAVHRSIRNPDFWTVTHTDSGFAACSALDEKENAEHMARVLEPLADWNFTDPATVKKWPKDISLRVTTLIRDIRNDDVRGWTSTATATQEPPHD